MGFWRSGQECTWCECRSTEFSRDAGWLLSLIYVPIALNIISIRYLNLLLVGAASTIGYAIRVLVVLHSEILYDKAY
jgi:hypothetical protein